MIKSGFTATPTGTCAIAWKVRRCNKNRVKIFPGTVGIVVGARWSKYSRWYRADIGGIIHALHPWDWGFTSIRVGELRRWKDGRDGSFLVAKIESLASCECLGDGKIFGTSCRYLEEFSEVISEKG